MTSNLAHLISRATADLNPIAAHYSEQLPDPAAIAAQCDAQDAKEVVATIDSLFKEREEAELSGEANGDELDDYFRAMQRYASLLPHLAGRFPNEVIFGLTSQARSTRLFVADALCKAPIPQAIEPLEIALGLETFDHIRRKLEEALVRCKADQPPVKPWWRRLFGNGA